MGEYTQGTSPTSAPGGTETVTASISSDTATCSVPSWDSHCGCPCDETINVQLYEVPNSVATWNVWIGAASNNFLIKDSQSSVRFRGRCGDGRRDSTEGCDDGNLDSGDGCSSTCAVEESNYVCRNGGCSAADTCYQRTGANNWQAARHCGHVRDLVSGAGDAWYWIKPTDYDGDTSRGTENGCCEYLFYCRPHNNPRGGSGGGWMRANYITGNQWGNGNWNNKRSRLQARWTHGCDSCRHSFTSSSMNSVIKYGCHDVDNSYIRFADQGGWNNAYLWIQTIKNAKTSTGESDETYRNTVNWNYYDQRDLKWYHKEYLGSYDTYVGSWWAGDNNSGGHNYWAQSNEVDRWIQGTEAFSSNSDFTGFWWFIGMHQGGCGDWINVYGFETILQD